MILRHAENLVLLDIPDSKMQLEELGHIGRIRTGSMPISMHRNQCISMDFQIENSSAGIIVF